MSETAQSVTLWDPLAGDTDPGMVLAAQRREIRNVLRSYTGYYDLFSELIQNSMDAVERRVSEVEGEYQGQIWIEINMPQGAVSITDNGCAMDESQLRQFLRPNFSFKDERVTKGNKGVGATYLAYGFNHLEIAVKHEGRVTSGVLRRGRDWLEDKTDSITRPKVEIAEPSHAPFGEIDQGVSMVVKLTGESVRPRDLAWIGAESADQWAAVLRTVTPLGAVALCEAEAPDIKINLRVIDSGGAESSTELDRPGYLYPNETMTRVANIGEYLADRKTRFEKGQDISVPPPKFRGLHGIWGEWTGEEILDSDSDSPIVPRLDEREILLVEELGLTLRIFLAFSTELWDSYNDRALGLRQGQRLLRGGLQLCTRQMPQGLPITIPMTNNIGFQNLAHVLVHVENSEPDLGRKGFQPEVARVAEKLAVSAVTAMRRHYNLLRRPGAARAFSDELKLQDWKDEQIEHEKTNPLVITGTGLFAPTEELAIRSEPIVEQDVVALFNQMISSGVVRGIQLLSSSQYKQYDGLYRINMTQPFNRYELSDTNPLGIDAEYFIDRDSLQSVVKVLEYKYTVDGLIEEIQGDEKSAEDVDIIVAWELGERWKGLFDVVSYLDEDNVHLRTIHGATHSFTHAMTGTPAFEAIILQDLVGYLADPQSEQARQREKLELEE